MIDDVRRLFFYSQVSFFSLVAVSILLAPESLTINHGLSFFEVEAITIIPYSFALILGGWFLFRMAQVLTQLPGRSPTLSRWLLALLPPLVGILLTPYSLNAVFADLHQVFGATFFLLQLGLMVWLLAVVRRDWLSVGLLVLQLAGGVVALVSLHDAIQFEIEGQLLFQLSFAAGVARVLWPIYLVSGADHARR